MKLYFAPMEGITTYVYRKVHNEVFGGCDAYYSPFITPSDNERLIIHPRIRSEFYKGKADLEAFSLIYGKNTGSLCYNGDVYNTEDYKAVTEKFPGICGVMIGRGAVKNPAIFREIKGGDLLKREELIYFTKRLSEEYMQVLLSDTFTLHKLKEVWEYLALNFPDNKRLPKAIKKAATLSDLVAAVTAEL